MGGDSIFYSRSMNQELLMQAASYGDVQEFSTLISRIILEYPSSNLRATCYDAMEFAAQNGHANIVKELLRLAERNTECGDLWCFHEDDNAHPGAQAIMHKWYFYGARVTSSPLHLAVREGHLSVVQEFVRFFQDHAGSDHTPSTIRPGWARIGRGRAWFQGLVEWAVRWGHAQILGLLLTSYPLMVPLRAINDADRIPLPVHLAAQQNNLDILRLIHLHMTSEVPPLFEVSFETRIHGLTALHASAPSGSKQTVEFFVETARMDVNSRSDPELFTPLHIAADSGNLQVVKLLLNNVVGSEACGQWGVDLLARDCMGRTALHYAARHGHEAVVQELLCCASKMQQQQQPIMNTIASIADRDGLLPLHMAARSGHAGVIEKLITSNGATVTVGLNQQAKNSLQIKTWVEKEYMRMASSYTRMGVYHGTIYRFRRPKLMDSLFFQTRGFTPLHFAARYGHKKALEKLMGDKSIDFHVKDDEGFSALDWMEVQTVANGQVFSECLKELEVNECHKQLMDVEALKQACLLCTSKRKLKQYMASDINDEKEAMDDLQQAWHRGCGPPLGAAIVRWLEEEDIGRVRKHWLQYWAGGRSEGHIEMVRSFLGVLREFEAAASKNRIEFLDCLCLHGAAVDAAMGEAVRHNNVVIVRELLLHVRPGEDYIVRGNLHDGAVKRATEVALGSDNANIVRELILHWPAGNMRAEAAYEALSSALRSYKYESAKEIFLQVPEVATNKQTAKMVEEKLLNASLYPKGDVHHEGFRDFVVALLISRVGLSNASNLLRELLAWASKDEKLRSRGVVEVILERPEVKKGLYEDRQVYLDCANAILVGSALIAGLAFQGWLQPPLGFNYAYEGRVYAEVHDWTVRLFWRFNNGAFFLSVGALTAAAKGAVPVANALDLVGSVEKAKRSVAVASTLLGVALLSVMAAFIMAELAVLPPLSSDRQMVVSAATWGGIMCTLVLLWFAVSVWPLLRPTLAYFLSGVVSLILNCIIFITDSFKYAYQLLRSAVFYAYRRIRSAVFNVAPAYYDDDVVDRFPSKW